MSIRYFIFDTETTGLPQRSKGRYANYNELEKYQNSRIIEIAWMIYENNKKIKEKEFIIKPKGEFQINPRAFQCHGISREKVEKEGIHMEQMIDEMMTDLINSDKIVGYNVSFDLAILRSELYRINSPIYIDLTFQRDNICLMWESRRKLNYKRLVSCTRVYEDLYQEKVTNAHRALKDVELTAKILIKLIEIPSIEQPSSMTKEISPKKNENKKKITLELIPKVKPTLQLTLK
jgi:DNA polymerase-3 subunit alpha